MSAYRLGKYRDRVVSGPIIPTLLSLGIPPLLSHVAALAYNIADSYWLSLYSELAVAVPRQIRPIIMLFDALLMALNAACLSIVSQHVGGKNYREASLSASRFFTLALVSGASLNILLLTLREAIFKHVLFTPQEIFDYVMVYSGVVAFDVFFNYIVLTYTTILQSLGDTRRPAIINGFAVTVNIMLDPFLILGFPPFPRLGVIGAAATDVMGKIISIVFLTYVIRRNYPELNVRLTSDLNADWARLVLRIGLPILAMNLTNGFAFLFQLQIVNTLGVIVATAYSIGFIAVDIIDVALFGLGGATAVMVGQNLGADKAERAREAAYKSALLVFSSVAASAVLVYPFRVSLVDVFADNPEIISESALFLQTSLFTFPFFGLFMVGMSVGRGSGHTAFPTVIGIIRLWALRIGLGYFLAFILGMGSMGVWLALAASNIVSGALSILWIKHGGWAKAVIAKPERSQ